MPELLARGYKVRAMVRTDFPEYHTLWPHAEIAVADALKKDTLKEALQDIDAAYYLIHSLRLGPRKFAAADIRAARNFKKAAEEALIQPIIATKVLKEFAMLDKKRVKEGNKFYNGLTDREKEILRLIVLGGTNKQIAQKLDISEKTVKNHISNIFQTLHVTNRTQAAIYALEKKL